MRTTRRARSGVVYSPEEALTVEQALRAYTMGSADALGVADTAGSITVGKQADLVSSTATRPALTPRTSPISPS